MAHPPRKDLIIVMVLDQVLLPPPPAWCQLAAV